MAEKKKRKTYPDPNDPNLDPREKQMIASSKKLAKCKGLKGKALDACLKPLGRRLGKSGEWELIRDDIEFADEGDLFLPGRKEKIMAKWKAKPK